jgi:3-isopropylmalate/(R)-2-methylmalate dehydratase small subunit
MLLSGRVWKYGDDLRATDLVSPQYDKQGLSGQWTECAKHVLESVDPTFVAGVQRGDILVAGKNLGAGHAHYYMTAIMACRTVGLSALLGDPVSALFQRAAVDQGLLAWSFAGLHDLVTTGDLLEIDLAGGRARNLSAGRIAQLKPVAPLVLEICQAGGSRNWALRRVGAEHAIA